MFGSDSGFAARVKAVLGPTNTGKTHLAIERMLAHSSGIIGFPLRLLARENYDRMVERKGAKHVALITGEEKIVPPEARWFSCTVEAMPLDRAAEFVAVDEIQLCADPDRGHVFTDRLLHARGMVETMFLGSETIRPLLQRLVPQAQVETRPRLSHLTYAGPSKMVRLPPRTAVVAFSAAEVYAIAELIRRRKGGCAVVMGRLSPRTRNAQVALYQDREVDFLVATDAIGMGLNMNVDHVAFAGLGKFDGHRPRKLTAAEIGQIAGRAGRGMKDGTFGTTTQCPPLSDDVVAAVESHHFEPLDMLCWRNSDLDFAGVDALLDSLTTPPPRPGLVRGNDASDLETLLALSRDGDIRKLAVGRTRLRLLWDACQIPDFRKLTDETHARLCARVFTQVAQEKALPTDWLANQIASLDRSEGDIDTLMQRLSGIRVWSYIAARADWVKDTQHWQAKAREVEDKLSDALHERLLSRFVDRRSAHLMRRLEAGEGEELLSAVTMRGEVVVEGHLVGHVEGFDFAPDPEAAGEEKKLVLRAARRSLRAEMPRRVTMLENAPDTAFAVTDDHILAWNDAPVARLQRGETPLRPRVQVLDSAFLDGAERERIRRRLQAWTDQQIRQDLAPLFAAEAAARDRPTLRGPLHRLMESLGVIPGVDEETLAPDIRSALRAFGVRSGRFALFIPALLKPRSAQMRARLWALFNGVPAPALPPAGLVSLAAAPHGWPPGFAAVAGWIEAGPILLRLDVAEKVAGELGYRARRGPAAIPAGLASRFAIKADLLPAVLRRLGFRVLPAPVLAPREQGPPAPAMILPLRRRKPQHEASIPMIRPSGPFAALAVLRR
ncbi:helicase-related protein [Rhodopila sp.]|jgi:ATP-dependent RNA helicase SUPV3L1/SUV3|uniref:helicase-related protein n=1 Tax=Rhodopila sp. TaxID=2480087 RepID=UPI002CD1114E|nr:helicase-related protein [Rhodopila sp.]HVZ09049.1 helicase-related protein [Rhodopila sp.]